MITVHTGKSDEVFLRELQEARCRSTIIEELCQRLEQRVFAVPDVEAGDLFNCPVCGAEVEMRETPTGRLALG